MVTDLGLKVEIPGLSDRAVISELFTLEAAKTTDPDLRARLEEIPGRYCLPILPVPPESEALVAAYMAEKAFTPGNWLDASHVAVAAFYRCDELELPAHRSSLDHPESGASASKTWIAADRDPHSRRGD